MSVGDDGEGVVRVRIERGGDSLPPGIAAVAVERARDDYVLTVGGEPGSDVYAAALHQTLAAVLRPALA